MNWLVSILYGFISGLSVLLPVSTDAHDFFLKLMTRMEPDQPFLQLCIHLAALSGLLLLCRHRAFHIYREMGIASQPSRHRKRQPDLVAVLDGRVILTVFVPAVLGLLLSGFARERFGSLPVVVLLLIVSGIAIYLPQHIPTANRDSRHLSRFEALTFGICAGFSALPGISRMGGLLSAGALRGCSRSYMLDIALLLMIPLLGVMVLLDLLALVSGGLAAISLLYALQCILAGFAAFGGACLAIAVMRFLSVNMGYSIFAYYNWGLGIFGFIIYLMI